MGGKLGAGEFDWQLGTDGNIVDRDPGDVMLDRVGMGYAGADSNLYFVEIAGSRGHRTRDRGDWGDGNHRDVLFGFPVGALYQIAYHMCFSIWLPAPRMARHRTRSGWHNQSKTAKKPCAIGHLKSASK